MLPPVQDSQQQQWLCAGIGQACMGRVEMFRLQHGVAVQLTQRLYDVPSLNGERHHAVAVTNKPCILVHSFSTPVHRATIFPTICSGWACSARLCLRSRHLPVTACTHSKYPLRACYEACQLPRHLHAVATILPIWHGDSLNTPHVFVCVLQANSQAW